MEVVEVLERSQALTELLGQFGAQLGHPLLQAVLHRGLEAVEVRGETEAVLLQDGGDGGQERPHRLSLQVRAVLHTGLDQLRQLSLPTAGLSTHSLTQHLPSHNLVQVQTSRIIVSLSC